MRYNLAGIDGNAFYNHLLAVSVEMIDDLNEEARF
jgi:hypothetical protein